MMNCVTANRNKNLCIGRSSKALVKTRSFIKKPIVYSK